MPVRALTFATLLCTLFMVHALPAAGEDNEDPRVREAMQELKTAETLRDRLTNENERALMVQRVGLAQKKLENARKLAELKDRESKLTTQRRTSTDYALREMLSMIETSKSDPEKALRSLEYKIRSARRERAKLEAEQSKAKDETDEDARAKALLAVRLSNLDARLFSLMAKRASAELKIRLADEALRIAQFKSELDLNPHPTIKLILKKRRGIGRLTKDREQYQLLHESLEAERADTVASLEIATEQFAGLDKDIELWDDLYSVAKKTRVKPEDKQKHYEYRKELRSKLYTAESRKDLMEDRLEDLREQSDAIGESLAHAAQARDLLDTEIAFRRSDVSVLHGRYLHRIMVPIILVILLVLVDNLVRRRLLPLFFAKDSLFVARRLSRYIVLFVIAVILILFFLEDLSAIATAIGIVGAAIVIALQDLCSSFAGWFVIVASGKVKVGDRVEIDGHRGDILDIQLLRTTLLELNNWLGVDEPTGRIVIVPNSFIFKHQVFNYAHVHKYIWGKIDITVTFETPAKAAYELLWKILTEETKEQFESAARGGGDMEMRYGMRHTVDEPKIHTVIADSGVCYSLFYVAHYKQFTATRDRLTTRILEEFEKSPGVEFAYPTERHIPTPEAPAT